MNRTLLEEHFRIQGWEEWYEAIEAIQADIDVLPESCNLKRRHQGYRVNGRTRAQALREAIGRKSCRRSSRREEEEATEEAA